MALIDASQSFARRREEARRSSGEFGEQTHSAPELALDAVLDQLDALDNDPELRAALFETGDLGPATDRTRAMYEDLVNGTEPLYDYRGEPSADVWDEAVAEDKARAEQKIRRSRPTTFVSLKETNEKIRIVLDEQFPGVKFVVRGHSYSGGASTDISWTDGPTESEVRRVADAFQDAGFDGMTDSQYYTHTAGYDPDGTPRTISYGADYIHTHREFSEPVQEAAQDLVTASLLTEGQTYDPNTRYSIPQGIYRYATSKNGGRYPGENGGFTFDGLETWGSALVRLAERMVGTEEYRRTHDIPADRPDPWEQAKRPHEIVKKRR